MIIICSKYQTYLFKDSYLDFVIFRITINAFLTAKYFNLNTVQENEGGGGQNVSFITKEHLIIKHVMRMWYIATRPLLIILHSIFASSL